MLLADRYAELQSPLRVRERMLFQVQRCPSELEIQARWYAGEFGRQFTSTTGQKIEIAQFGVWNREAGPDFRDVAIRIDGAPAIKGCIELDLTDRSWEGHGHATNPAFEATVLHLFLNQSEQTFFSRTLSNRNVPQVRLDLAALSDAFDSSTPLAHAGRCQAPLRDLPQEQVDSILSGAAQFRLRRKGRRLLTLIDSHGRDEALFQEIASALGYKENKLAFHVLAQRVGLKPLRGDALGAEALLFGFAGFLQVPDLAQFPVGTRDYVRGLWDKWWPYRDEMSRLILPRETWRITGTRPLNHPHRRLGALAVIVSHWAKFRRAIDSSRMESVQEFLGALDHPFWRSHYTLSSESAAKPMALLGDSRITDILANICFPLWSSGPAGLANYGSGPAGLANPGVEGTVAWKSYAQLRSELSNRRVETAATRLLGDDQRRRQFTKSVAHQQGLLQIYEDFCLRDHSDCEQCPFPEQMLKWEV